MMKNTSTTYGSLSKLLHWLMALTFVGMFIVAYIMINISKSDFRFSLYDLHKATGMLLFCLVVVRLSWRFSNVQPTLSQTIPYWQHAMAKMNILLLYFLMFAMPITGFLTSTLGGHEITFYHIFNISPLGHDKSTSEFFSSAHEILSYLLIFSVTLHLAAAFYHHYLLKDDVLKRMWINNE